MARKRDNSESIRENEGEISLIRVIIAFIAAVVLIISVYKLVMILNNYEDSNNEYKEIESAFTSERETDGEIPDTVITPEIIDGQETGRYYEDAPVPVDVDWEHLKELNSDIVAWIYVESLPEISYPVVRGENNSYYLHRTFTKQSKYAGSIFEDYHNARDFSDPNTIVYGHNMRNGSMFNHLKRLKNQETYEKSPYFWILTPEGNYRYHIFSVYDTNPTGQVFTFFTPGYEGFQDWLEARRKDSVVTSSIPLFADDNCVTLSTCTSDSKHRTVVLGVCCSTARPPKGQVPEWMIEEYEEERQNDAGSEAETSEEEMSGYSASKNPYAR